MFSRPATPLFDLLQHRYKELWMEEQRARTRVQHAMKKKVRILQQCFPLLCTALLGTTPSLSHPTRDGWAAPSPGKSSQQEKHPLTTKRLVKPNKDGHPPARSPTSHPLDISSAQVTCDSGPTREQSTNADRTAPALSLAWGG